MSRDSSNFKKNRSDSYQWVLLESPCSPEVLTEFSDSQGFTGKLNEGANSEAKYELQEQLKAAFWRLINEQLTPRQSEVLRLYADGYTQIEIAKKLKVNQSSITKSINGNCDYKNSRRIYGGSKRKLRRLITKDPEIQLILKKIAELDDI